jgi:hypothetical protein
MMRYACVEQVHVLLIDLIVCAFSSRSRYIALYNYKPLKEDEMELKAGESYYVVEKCKDGWFKGFSLTNQKRGVFPGNYVRLAR